jgi:hypothetical protein
MVGSAFVITAHVNIRFSEFVSAFGVGRSTRGSGARHDRLGVGCGRPRIAMVLMTLGSVPSAMITMGRVPVRIRMTGRRIGASNVVHDPRMLQVTVGLIGAFFKVAIRAV